MDIAATLRSFDGRRVAPFRAVAEVVQADPARAFPELLELAASDEAALQIGASWVIKELAGRGWVPTGRWAAQMIDLVGRPSAPDATLHLLQTLPRLKIPADRKEELGRVLVRLVGSKRAFVRAWAYNGLGVLAGQYPEMRSRVEAALEGAEEEAAASVRVRIRRVREGLG